jgi:ribosomal protein S18 acetylase RimI-like enzyme
VIIREALAEEMDAVGSLRVEAYEAQNFLGASSPYAATLRALGADGHGTVLVAIDSATRKLLGTVMLEPWHDGSEVARGPEESEVRALAVARESQRQGVGRALMLAVMSEAAASGAKRLLLSTREIMAAAQALYASLGFVRLPELDWAPAPGVALLAFGFSLDGKRAHPSDKPTAS